MTLLKNSVVAFTAITNLSFGQVTTSVNAPTTDIISSLPDGTIDTALFDEDANANHARGQFFTLGDGTGSQFQINAITIKKSTAQSYADDTLTFRIFQGTQAQWVTGTGHTTATNGDDYFAGTGVIPRYTEAFNLVGTFADNAYLTFTFAQPIIVDELSEFGFLMTYDQDNVASQDRFRHREGSASGRASISTTAHAMSGRNIVYFVQGTPIGEGLGQPVIIPSANLIEAGGSVDLNISFDPGADSALLTTPAGTVDLIALDASDETSGDGMVLVSESPTSTFTYRVTLTLAGETDTTAEATVQVIDPANQAANNAFSTAIKTDSPLFYFRYEEDVNAGYLFDSSGNSNHTNDITGTLAQGALPGGMQKAINFSAPAGIRVPVPSQMNQSFTLTAVMNTADFAEPGLRNVFSMTDGNGIGRSILYYSSSRFQTFISGATINIPVGTAFLKQTSCLIHFVYNADPDANPLSDDQQVQIYLNGQPLGDPVFVGVVADNVGNWVIGSNKTRSAFPYLGFIDETAVFESALSAAQIAAHGTAFFTAADPLLGFTSNTTEVPLSGDPVTLTWKTSDTAATVTLNGNTVAGATAGGIQTLTVNPRITTTYTLTASGPGGPYTKEITVTVIDPTPLVAPEIINIAVDSANPRSVTIQIQGNPAVAYPVTSSLTLAGGFTTIVGNITTDATGAGSITFQSPEAVRFFRVELP